MKIKINKYVKLALKIVISGGLLYFVFTKVDLKSVAAIISRSNWLFLFAATVLFILSKILSSIRLNKFIKCTGLELEEKHNMKLYWLGMYYNLFLPGGIGGDGYKIFYLNKHYKTSAKSLFWALLLDRITGLLSLFLLLIVLYYLLPDILVYPYLVWLLAPVSIVLLYLGIRKFFPSYSSIFTISNIQALGVQLLQLGSSYFILLALNIQTDTFDYLFVFLISSVVSVIPFTIGGMGARELTFLYGSVFLGLNESNSIALSLVFYLITAVVSLWGIYYSLLPDKLKKA